MYLRGRLFECSWLKIVRFLLEKMEFRPDDFGSLQEANVRVRSLELAGEADKVHQPIKSWENTTIVRSFNAFNAPFSPVSQTKNRAVDKLNRRNSQQRNKHI